MLFPDPFPVPVDAQRLYGDPVAYFSSHDEQRSRAGHRELLARAIALSNNSEPALLDVGCGRGDLLSEARAIGIKDVVGLDFAESMVTFARDHYAVTVLQMTAEDYAQSVTDRTFDVVFLNAVIEHVHDPDALMASVAQLTHPGSVLFVDTPRDPNLVTFIGNATQRLVGKSSVYNLSPSWPPFHVFGFSPKTLKLLLDKFGFDLLELHCHTGNTAVPPTPGLGGRSTAWVGTQVTRLGNVCGLATNMDAWARRR